jgi:hypothetical protein
MSDNNAYQYDLLFHFFQQLPDKFVQDGDVVVLPLILNAEVAYNFAT